MEFHHGTTAYSTLVTNVQYSNSCLDDSRHCKKNVPGFRHQMSHLFAAGIGLNFSRSSVSSIIQQTSYYNNYRAATFSHTIANKYNYT